MQTMANSQLKIVCAETNFVPSGLSTISAICGNSDPIGQSKEPEKHRERKSLDAPRMVLQYGSSR